MISCSIPKVVISKTLLKCRNDKQSSDNQLDQKYNLLQLNIPITLYLLFDNKADNNITNIEDIPLI
jgi:hypothetical protein